MAARNSPRRYKIPDGFESLLEGLAKEVLRSQPDNIYLFAADYFDSLLNIRESTNTTNLSSLVSLRGGKVKGQTSTNRTARSKTSSVSSYESEATYHSENENDKTGELPTSLEKGSQQFIKLKSKIAITGGDFPDHKEDTAAVIIQANYRGYQTRKCIKVKERQGEAATKIQAGFRGHKVRNDLKFKIRKEESAAVKIQSNFRGYRDRKRYSVSGAPVRRRGLRDQIYPGGSVSVSSDSSLVEYRDLESVNLDRNGSDRNNTRKSKVSSESEQSDYEESMSGRSEIASGLTSVTDVGDELLYRDEMMDEEYLDGTPTFRSESAQTAETDMTEAETGVIHGSKEAHQAAAKIQAGYRGMVVRKGRRGNRRRLRDKHCKENKAATVIQANYKGFRIRKNLEIHHRHASDDTKPIVNSKVSGSKGSHSLINESATKIQASYRGYKTRKDLTIKHQSATKIQATYRGHRARKHGKEAK